MTMAPFDPPKPFGDIGTGNLPDDRDAIRRMVAEDRAKTGPAPFAIVMATPSGRQFYVRCREHGIIEGRYRIKADAQALADAHIAYQHAPEEITQP